jgi:hypothetical protein
MFINFASTHSDNFNQKCNFVFAQTRPGGIIQMTNNLGRARHSVRAAGWQSTRSAGRGLPALPVFAHLFVIWIIPIIFKNTLATSAGWARLALPNENWALGGWGDKLNRV